MKHNEDNYSESDRLFIQGNGREAETVAGEMAV